MIYAFVLVPAGRKEFKIKSLAHSMDMFNFVIKNITVLGEGTQAKYDISKKYLTIRTPEKITDTMPVCFKIEVD